MIRAKMKVAIFWGNFFFGLNEWMIGELGVIIIIIIIIIILFYFLLNENYVKKFG
jgi:hypothetical protein